MEHGRIVDIVGVVADVLPADAVADVVHTDAVAVLFLLMLMLILMLLPVVLLFLLLAVEMRLLVKSVKTFWTRPVLVFFLGICRAWDCDSEKSFLGRDRGGQCVERGKTELCPDGMMVVMDPLGFGESTFACYNNQGPQTYVGRFPLTVKKHPLRVQYCCLPLESGRQSWKKIFLLAKQS